MKVLVVDDNATNRKILHRQVGSWGMKDGMAEDSSQALEVLREVLERWVGEGAELAEASTSPEPGTAPEEPPLDLSVIETLQSLQEEGEPNISRELIEMFLEDAEDRLKKMREAVHEQDAQRLRQEAHTLKGSSGNMGATGMARISSELESLTEASRLLDALGEEFGRVRPTIRT